MAAKLEKAFLRQIQAAPDSDGPRVAYADWLENNRDPRAAYLRLDIDLCGIPGTGRHFQSMFAQLRELRTKIDRDWLITVSRSFYDHVHSLEVRTSTDDSETWRLHRQIKAPPWPIIEAAIHKLDQERQPFLVLRFDDEPQPVECMNIVGGNGTYAIDGILQKRAFRYLDDSKDSKQMSIRKGEHERIWRRQQALRPEREICTDLAQVLRAAKYAYYFKELAPGIPWFVDEPVADEDDDQDDYE